MRCQQSSSWRLDVVRDSVCLINRTRLQLSRCAVVCREALHVPSRLSIVGTGDAIGVVMMVEFTTTLKLRLEKSWGASDTRFNGSGAFQKGRNTIPS
jgi:hypothetical protein